MASIKIKIKLLNFLIVTTSLGAFDIKTPLFFFPEDADFYPFSSWIKYFSGLFLKAIYLEKCECH